MSQQAKADTNDILVRTKDELMAQARAVAVDPLAIWNRALEHCVRLDYPSEQRRERARALMVEHWLSYKQFMEAGDLPSMRRKANELTWACQKLTAPIPVVTFSEHLAGMVERMNREVGWLTVECEDLKRYADGGAGGIDRIVSFDVHSAIFASGRTVTRAQLREDWRMPHQPPEEFHQTRLFLEREQAEAAAVAAMNARQRDEARSHLVSAGPGWMVGRPPSQ
jgi:hypothetical protein